MAESSQPPKPEPRPDEIHWGIAYLREDLQDVRQDMQRHREETQQQFQDVRQDMQRHREETQQQFQDVHQDMQRHREETQQQFRETREENQQQFRETREENQQQFKETRLDYSALRQQMDRQFRWLIGIMFGLFSTATGICIAIVKL